MKRLLGVFRKEPPQVIALILSYLKPELVRQIYAELPPEIQTKVAAESGALRQATEEQVRMVDENIKAKIDFLVGGVDNLIKILDEVDYKIRDNILEYLMNHRPQLYEKVRGSICSSMTSSSSRTWRSSPSSGSSRRSSWRAHSRTRARRC